MNTFDALKWTLCSQQFYRLAAFRIDKSRMKLVTDYVELLWSFAVIGIIVGELCYCGYKIHLGESLIEHNHGKKGTHMVILIVYLEFALTVMCGIYFLINAVVRRFKQINLIKKFAKIDDTLGRTFNVILNHRLFARIALCTLVAVLVYYNLVVPTILYFPVQHTLHKSVNALVIFVVYVVQAATSGVFTHGFVSYVWAIYARVMRLNVKLETIVRYPPEQLEIFYKSKNELCMEMMRYTKVYKQLCSCVEDLNRIYGFSLVLHFTHDFTLLTSQIFSMFYVSFYEEWDDSKRTIFGLVIWMIPNILKITFICFACHVTRNEIEACSLNLRKFSNEANEDDLSDLVDMFSLQSIHLKTEFTANNFFSIDMSLFYTIISACTTYLVILIQFKNYEDENTDAVAH